MTKPASKTPFPESYWVIPGKFLAGKYPAEKYADEITRKRIRNLLDTGVSLIVDLTEANETISYTHILQEQAGWLSQEVVHARYPIGDFEIPPVDMVRKILDRIDETIQNGGTVYVHCRGGIGRTGTIVGCYLARHGIQGQQAINQIAELRAQLPNHIYGSPESDAQKELVRNWREDT